MDQLIIKDLELFAYHGVNPEEKSMGQKFIVEIKISMDLSEAGESDVLDTSINYAQLCHELQDVFTQRKHDLIERAASVLCDHILVNYKQVTEVDLTLKKPWAPIHLPLKYPAIRLVRRWHQAYIAVGSNMGDKKKHIEDAMTIIEQSWHTDILDRSDLIETEPVGYTDQDNFINGVFEIRTLLTPSKLIHWLLGIEEQLKRERTIPLGPRTIDLDIIYYDDIINSTKDAVIPHPRMQDRSFVLVPLNQIAPYKMHPILGKRTFQLLDDLKK